MLLVFVHGWSVTDTDTYGNLPQALEAEAHKYGLEIDIHHIWLGRYISFHDEVSMADVVRAFDQALRDQIPGNKNRRKPFSCITHSTGGPVVREWVERFFGASRLKTLPLQHLVMLAPANHGSSLANLGKTRVGRIKSWSQGVEPGQRILDWLSLGSDEQWTLCERYLAYEPADNNYFPFVLVGQTIDTSFYDFLNSYLTEVGSDGVVRVAGANLNYGMVNLREIPDEIVTVNHGRDKLKVGMLEAIGGVRRPQHVPLGVIPGASHSGETKGIMRSVTKRNAKSKPVVDEILKCLQVRDATEYAQRADALRTLTTHAQIKHSKPRRYVMLIFNIRDDQGDPINDYDLFLLAGSNYAPDKLPRGFFVDRQKNKARPNRLVYYLNYESMRTIKDELLGFRVIARPRAGYSYYSYYNAVEFRLGDIPLNAVLTPNETLYVDIEINRRVDEEVFRLDPAADGSQDFKDQEPSGKIVK